MLLTGLPRASDANLLASTPILVPGFQTSPTDVGAQHSNAAAFLASIIQNFAALTAHPGEWTIENEAGSGAQSIATMPAGGAGVCHVLRSLLVVCSSKTDGLTTIEILDGAAVKWRFTIRLVQNVNATVVVPLTGLNIIGSPNTDLIIQQTAAEADLTASLNASGYSTS